MEALARAGCNLQLEMRWRPIWIIEVASGADESNFTHMLEQLSRNDQLAASVTAVHALYANERILVASLSGEFAHP